MKTSEKKIEEEKVKTTSKETLDPYAVDFFGGLNDREKDQIDNSNSISDSKKTEKVRLKYLKGLDWYKSLPKYTYEEIDFSNQLNKFPKSFSQTLISIINEVFNDFTKFAEKSITFEVNSIKEVSLSGSLSALANKNQVFLFLQCNSTEKPAIVSINSEFVIKSIDLILGGEGKSSEVLRKISAIEKTIVEFLSLTIISKLNQKFDDLGLYIQDVTNEILTGNDNYERGAQTDVTFKLGALSGDIKILLPMDFLNTIENSIEKLFVYNKPKRIFEIYKKISDSIALNLDIGKTRVNANDVLFLEKDDVILLEQSNKDLQNQIKVYIGDSTNYFFNGTIITDEKLDNTEVFSNQIRIEIDEIFAEKDIERRLKREKMEATNNKDNPEITKNKAESDNQANENNEAELLDDENEFETDIDDTSSEELDQQALSSLENVMINLRVNMGGRRLSLAELQKIRVGQIIELGCRPNDPVEVVTDSDNKPIAIGELIEIEGQIGVRLTKVLV